jgi:RNA polymerase sigma factor (sigma-70 family)
VRPSSTDTTTTNSLHGPTSAFEDSIRDLGAALLGYFLRRVEPAEDAADCLSETLMILWRKRDQLPGDADSLRAWSYGVAKGVLANYRRGRIRRGALAERLRAGLVHTPLALEDDDDPVHIALSTLRPTDRELVMLIIWDGFGVGEAGKLLGLSPTAARSRYARARAKLKVMLCPSGGVALEVP